MSSLIEMRIHAREIFLAGLASADPLKAIKQCVRLRNDQLYVADCSYDLSQIGKIVVTGCGKAAAKMALAMEELLDARISAGAVVVKYGHGLPLKKVGPEDCGPRQKASQVYARGGLAGTGRPSTRFQRSSGMLRVHSTTSRAYGLIRVERLTRGASFGRCRAETGAVWVGHGAASAVPAGDNIRYAPQGASGLRLRAAHATCQGFGLAVILEVAVSECVDAFALYCAPLSSASAKRSSSP